MKLILLMAQTIDGKVARHDHHQADWTGAADKKYFAKVTRDAGVCIMGRKTFDTIGGPLPGRFNVVMTKNIGPKLSIGNLEFVEECPKNIIQNIEKIGFKTAVLIGGPTINTLFAKAGLIDEIHITVVPHIFGAGLSMFSEPLDIPLVFRTRHLWEDGSMTLVYDVLKGQQ